MNKSLANNVLIFDEILEYVNSIYNITQMVKHTKNSNSISTRSRTRSKKDQIIYK